MFCRLVSRVTCGGGVLLRSLSTVVGDGADGLVRLDVRPGLCGESFDDAPNVGGGGSGSGGGDTGPCLTRAGAPGSPGRISPIKLPCLHGPGTPRVMWLASRYSGSTAGLAPAGAVQNASKELLLSILDISPKGPLAPAGTKGYSQVCMQVRRCASACISGLAHGVARNLRPDLRR